MSTPVSLSTAAEPGGTGLPAANRYPEFAKVRDLEDFKANIQKAIRELGLTDFWFLPLHLRGKAMGQLSSMPEALFSAYREAGLYRHDLLLTYAKEQHLPLYASTLYDYLAQAPVDCGWLRGMREIQALHGTYGFYDYYCVIVRGEETRGRGMLAVTHRDLAGLDFRDHVKGMESRVQVLAGVIGSTGRKKFPKLFLGATPPVPMLTPQPLKVLTALANSDMTISQLADKLCVSSVTVHHHITTARRALGTRTNVGAIKRAMLLGLIDYDDI